MSSDVCKHCTDAACLDVCPTGALFRTEFGTVVVQEDVCNGCGYCVPACPFGVIDRREVAGPRGRGTRPRSARSATTASKDGSTPACAQACPTESIQFGPLDELRERAAGRLDEGSRRRLAGARLYGDDPGDGVGGFGAFFLLLDEPEVYGLPPDPVARRATCRRMWRSAAAALLLAASVALAPFGEAALMARRSTRHDGRSYYGRPIVKAPVWKRDDRWYFFTGGLAGASSLLGLAARSPATSGSPATRR